jgi:hypothetical protein
MVPYSLYSALLLTTAHIPYSQALEQSLDLLALTSFGVMDTTLEEVFLKVSEEDQSLENSDAGEYIQNGCQSNPLIIYIYI